MRCAAIDIGTVTARLLVADVDALGMHELYRCSEIVNLGAGVDETGILAPDAIERVCAVVAQYRSVIDELSQDEPTVVRCLATSASRDARNAGEFAARLAELGVELSVIPGEYEAQLSFLGASGDFAGERLLVVDAGGGSTELIAGVAGEGVVHSHSFNIGCRRATERLLKTDPPTPEEQAALAAWAHDEFKGFFDELDEMGFVPARLVAVAGTATSAVSIDQAMDPYDPERVHGSAVSAETLEALIARLAGMPLEERMQVVGLQPKRAPVIVAGFIILQQVLKLSGLPTYTASESDILEGIILSAVLPNGGKADAAM
ncbi:MAG: Ppx/GppA family phosphatase [Eggerthellaceae bacterium]|nr:Ppx/GppA family phosphatase [Eggerthellaceae bacterium]